MCSVATIILATFVTLVQTKDKGANDVADAQHFMGNAVGNLVESLADKLFIRMRQASHFHQADLDNMTLGKSSHLLTPNCILSPVSALQPFPNVIAQRLPKQKLALQSSTGAAQRGRSRPFLTAVSAQASAEDDNSSGEKGPSREDLIKQLNVMYERSPDSVPETPSAASAPEQSSLSRQDRLALERSKYQSMKITELKKELASMGIDTNSFFDKSDFVNALAEANIDGDSKKGGPSKTSYQDSPGQTSYQIPPSAPSTPSTPSTPASSTEKSDREARLEIEKSKLQSMRVSELKKELEALYVYTGSFLEKSDFVNALAAARVDGRQVSPKKSSANGPSRGPSAQKARGPSPVRASAVSDFVIPPDVAPAPVRRKKVSDDGASTFDVVLCRTDRMRSMFKRMVRGFRQKKTTKWSDAASTEWKLQKLEMTGLAGFIEQGSGFVDRDRDILEEDEVIPMLAINEELKIPCAAAFYSDAKLNDKNSYYLVKLIGNAAPRDQCKGAGSAILCHLIRNSQDKDGKFSPLKVHPIFSDRESKQYFQSFGCVDGNPVQEALNNVKIGGLGGYVPFTSPLVCKNRNPEKCEEAEYADVAFDADAYFTNIQGPR